MRKFYNKYFNIPKHDKVQDKVFSARIALYVFQILLLINVAGITAYSYFSNDIIVQATTITAAQYDLEYSVTDESDSPIIPQSNGNYLLGTGAFASPLYFRKRHLLTQHRNICPTSTASFPKKHTAPE